MNPMSNTVAVPEEPVEPIDRDIPDLKTKKKKNNITRLIVIGGILVALILTATGLALFMKQLENNKKKEIAEEAKKRPKAGVAAAAADFEAAQERIKRENALAEEEAARAAETDAANAAANRQLPPPASAIAVAATNEQSAGSAGRTGATPTATGGGAENSAPKPQTPAQRQMDGDVLLNLSGGSGFGDDGTRRAGSSGGLSDTARGPGAGNAQSTARQVADGPKNGLDDKVKPSALQAGVAGQRPDLSYLLHRGTSIPCGTITRIVSEHAGMIKCVVANDVYSSDGKMILVERGSVAFGERREVMMQGQARVAAIWSRIDTPYGVYVDVNSLATDPLGAAGIPASVDNHLSERFGGAILLSLIGDFGQALANKASDSRGTIQFGNTSTAGQDLASQTLQHTINIPPTGYVNHGEATTILVLRDMDFRSVYELARK